MSQRLVGHIRVGSVAGAFVNLATVVFAGSAASSAAPPDDTFELALRPTLLAAGQELGYSGSCWSEALAGPGDRAALEAVFVVPPGSGLDAYSFTAEATVAADGSFGGRVFVPPESPEGDYEVALECRDGRTVLGEDAAALVVRSDPSPPPSTASTTATTTTTVEPPGPDDGAAGPIDAEPADPIDAQPTFTG